MNEEGGSEGEMLRGRDEDRCRRVGVRAECIQEEVECLRICLSS